MAGSKSKILLFGKTGSGKSTVANMLIIGHLSPPQVFPTSSGVRGKTLGFQREESDDWVVVDTVGFGEGEHGSVEDAEAQNKLYDFFVKISEESYNYYAFVHKWGKINELDVRLWNFFKQAFEGVEKIFVIIFTHCNPKALEENLEDIKVEFQGCERYITVDFPASDKPETSASARTRRNEKLRVASLKRLQTTLASFLLRTDTTCLRSNLKKGRILLMGTATQARNMIAKLLVDGTVNIRSTIEVDASIFDGIAIDGIDKDNSMDFEEVEGRRWQVVNALAFDSASISEIYNGALTKVEAVTAASKMIASKFLTILQHGRYSHFVYVEESGKMPPACKSFLQESLKAVGGSIKTIAVIVNYDGKVQSEVSKQFKEMATVCQIQLPNFCDSTEREDEVILRHALVSLEETLLWCAPELFWRSLNNIANPNAFKGLVYAYQELHGMNRSNSLSKNLLQKFTSDFGEIDLLECASNFKTVVRLPSKHIAAEVPMNWHGRDFLASQFLRITISGDKTCLSQGLPDDFMWGELQIVDKHHVDRRFQRLSLFIGSRSQLHITRNDTLETWFVGLYNVIERNFIEKLSSEDTVILWMYPYPNPIVPHEDKFQISLRFLTICSIAL